MRYQVVLQESDTGYAVSVPELPGCIAQGRTEAEALDGIRAAIAAWQSGAVGQVDGQVIREVEVPAAPAREPAPALDLAAAPIPAPIPAPAAPVLAPVLVDQARKLVGEGADAALVHEAAAVLGEVGAVRTVAPTGGSGPTLAGPARRGIDRAFMDLTIECDQVDGGDWLAEVPQLSGVRASAASRQEAMAQAMALASRVLAERRDLHNSQSFATGPST